jgi:putative ABC transport system permease protein
MTMITVALRNLRHRPGGFLATFLSAFLGAALLMAFGSLLDTGPSDDDLVTVAGVGGGWCLIIVAFAVTSTLSLTLRERGPQLALLRRAGATESQLRRMVIGESAVVALIAAVAASPAGYGLGRLLFALLRDTGQADPGLSYAFGPIAAGAGVGVTVLGAIVAATFAARPARVRAGRPKLRYAAAALFLAAAAGCATVTATVMSGKGIDAMQTAGQAGIWASIGLALLAPELLHLVRRMLGVLVGRSAAGELALLGAPRLAGVVRPIILFTGIATATVYMQGIENRASAGQIQPEYAQSIRTLNYVIVGMITLFVAVMLVNSLIAATLQRRREFAQQRLAGSTRGQVLAMVALEGILVTVTGVLAGSVAALVTILPFQSARAGGWLPETTPLLYAVIVATAVALIGTALLGAARRTVRGPAVASLP